VVVLLKHTSNIKRLLNKEELTLER